MRRRFARVSLTTATKISWQHAHVTKACDQFPVTPQRSYDLVRWLLSAGERLKWWKVFKIEVICLRWIFIPFAGADPGFFLRGGALVSCSASTPINHIVFFLQNTSCIRKPQVISERGGAHPLHPPPRSAPVLPPDWSKKSCNSCFDVLRLYFDSRLDSDAVAEQTYVCLLAKNYIFCDSKRRNRSWK